MFFLFGGYERSFIIMKVPPQFLFQGREEKYAFLIYQLLTGKKNTVHAHFIHIEFFFFSPQCKLLGPPVNAQAHPRSQSSLLPVNG